MQKRHLDRVQYFRELAYTSERYIIPYIMRHHDVDSNACVLEIGCGEGGNLLPFARLGCKVVGVDISTNRIRQAKSLFEMEDTSGTFICDNILNIKGYNHRFDVIICHDVIEHIPDKRAILEYAHNFLKEGGVFFVAFPAWQMPFGGHQQICRNSVISKLPFVHLLPHRIFKAILTFARESEETISELLSIKHTKVTVEAFEALTKLSKWEIVNRCLYLVNPHYEIKYKLKPHKLPVFIAKLPHIRNFMSTSCFYLLKD